jgi:hypothetical protein
VDHVVDRADILQAVRGHQRASAGFACRRSRAADIVVMCQIGLAGDGVAVTGAVTDRLHGSPITANALNPGYVMTDLTRQAGGLLKVAVVLTSFRAQTALDGADTATWLAASPEAEGITGKFWNKRRASTRCRCPHQTWCNRLACIRLSNHPIAPVQ